ncbi:hypothetical protein MRX96_032782 [Rhipicephalus microplus]
MGGLGKELEKTSRLNLSAVAEYYVTKRFGSNLEDWSLTGGYRLPSEPSVHGTVHLFQYYGRCNRRKKFTNFNCKEAYSNIEMGMLIQCPSRLYRMVGIYATSSKGRLP